MGQAELHDSLLTPEEYLAGEELAATKHEYLGGVVYAMAGAANRHNVIASNALGLLFSQLRGNRCRPFNSDTKVRIRFPDHTRFYYPDAMVVREQSPLDVPYQDWPAVIVEVVSDSTRRTDEQEKRSAYLTISTLSVYIVLEQERAAAMVWRRGSGGFAREVFTGLDAVVPLPEIEAALPLAEVYAGLPLSAAAPAG